MTQPQNLRAFLIHTIVLCIITSAGVSVASAQTYEDCGSNCANLAIGKPVSYSGLWNATTNPTSKVNDGNAGTTSSCEGSTGLCTIASDSVGGQAVGNYLQIDLGQLMSVKSVTVYGRRDSSLTQAQNLNLKLSSDGVSWTTTSMSDTTSASGLTVSTASIARYVRVETTTSVYLSLYEIVVTGTAAYIDCGGACTNLATGKTVSYSGLWNATTNPASKVNDTNTGTTSTCEGSSGYCAIASDSGGGQAIGNYLQIDLGQLMSVKSVTVYGRRDTALTQGQNLELKLSVDGANWNTSSMADTTSASGYTVSTARLARYIRVETTTVVFLSLYELVVTGVPPTPSYVDCGGSCSNLATGKTVSYSGLWNATTNPATKVNDTNTGTTSTCEGSSGYCAIASDSFGGQAAGNYLQIDLGQPMSVKNVTVYGRRDTALTQGQNLNLKLSADGVNWNTTFMADTTSSSGLTVSTVSAARYIRVETTTTVFLSLYEIVVTGTSTVANYADCGGSCTNLAPGKTVTYSALWNATTNPASKVNDTNTGTTSTCEGSSGYCAIASDSGGGQAIGNYLQIDLGQLMSVKNVTVYGRRDTALTQGQNLTLKFSTDGNTWSGSYLADTTGSSGQTTAATRLARYVRVGTTTVNYLSLYEIVINGTP
jgi:hypothetical protein